MRSHKQKGLIIRDIQNNFQQAKAVIFYDFHQAENEEIWQLKKELKKTGSCWKVYKNNLVKKALPKFGLPLQQANALIFCYEDEYKPLNILARFNKKDPHLKRFHGGIYNQNLVTNMLLEK
jgi:ribosomal protein L10